MSSCSCQAHALTTRAASSPRTGITALRADFPILRHRASESGPLVYLDTAATAQKPDAVLSAERDFNVLHNANVHAGDHLLARESAELFDAARSTVAEFVGCAADELVFTRSASDAINLIATAIGRASPGVGPGDEVVVTTAEHHSNLIPWQMLCARVGATLRYIPVHDDGRLDLSGLDEFVSERARVVAFCHESNALGILNPVTPLVRRARQVGAITVLDASQSAPHLPLDQAELGVDFLVCSGHKMYGPTGIGMLAGGRSALHNLPAVSGGAHMEREVGDQHSTSTAPPARFEPGTPAVSQVVGLATACRYLAATDRDAVTDHERGLTEHAINELRAVPGLQVVGSTDTYQRGPVVSFTAEGIPAADLARWLDHRGIAVRAGDLSARPLCRRLGVDALVRASFGLYNTIPEIDALAEALDERLRTATANEPRRQDA